MCMGGNAERSQRNCLPHSPIGGYHTVRPLRGAVAPTQGGAQRAHVGVETGCDALSWARAIGHQPRLGPCMLVVAVAAVLVTVTAVVVVMLVLRGGRCRCQW